MLFLEGKEDWGIPVVCQPWTLWAWSISRVNTEFLPLRKCISYGGGQTTKLLNTKWWSVLWKKKIQSSKLAFQYNSQSSCLPRSCQLIRSLKESRQRSVWKPSKDSGALGNLKGKQAAGEGVEWGWGMQYSVSQWGRTAFQRTLGFIFRMISLHVKFCLPQLPPPGHWNRIGPRRREGWKKMCGSGMV